MNCGEWVTDAQGQAGHQSVDGEQLNCASLIFLGFYSCLALCMSCFITTITNIIIIDTVIIVF